MASGSLLPGVVGDRISASLTGRCTTVAMCGVVAARYAALPGCVNRSALISVISSYPTWGDFVMSVTVAGTVSSRTTSPCLLTTFAVEPIITPVRVSDAIDILACDVFQRADRTHQHGSDNVDGRDRRRDPNSACRCFVHRCLVHGAGDSIRNR